MSVAFADDFATIHHQAPAGARSAAMTRETAYNRLRWHLTRSCAGCGRDKEFPCLASRCAVAVSQRALRELVDELTVRDEETP